MFIDRLDAGTKLAQALKDHPLVQKIALADRLVLFIPRGCVVIGKKISLQLNRRHDVILVKKLGAPFQSELAIGAIAETGQPFIDQSLVNQIRVDDSYLREEINRVRAKIAMYKTKFRQDKELNLAAHLTILVDDGMATGETMKAAIAWLQGQENTHSKTYHLSPTTYLIVVPVAASNAATDIRALGVELVCLEESSDLTAIGQSYESFDQVTDEEVIKLLAKN